MFIPEFICGIGATLITELLLLIAYVVIEEKKKAKKRSEIINKVKEEK